MELADADRERLADIVRLQPTKNKELQERWELDSGSEVHRYLESTLKDYYYRDEDSLIRATSEAATLVGIDPETVETDPGRAEDGDETPGTVSVTEFESKVLDVLAGPDERSQSVVRVLQSLRETHGLDPEAGEVRRELQRLRRKGVVEVVYRTVPTFRLAVDRDELDVVVNGE